MISLKHRSETAFRLPGGLQSTLENRTFFKPSLIYVNRLTNTPLQAGGIVAKERLRRLRAMLLLRSFESALLRQPKPGFQLLSRGEEAIAVGICTALERTDPLLCSGRSIGIALARGVPAGGLLAELAGKDGGPNKGRAGRAHVSMPSVGLFGAHGVVGGNISVAAGVALAQQQLGTHAVTCCVFGDGACGAGSLHETLNVAALWQLPLLLICDNNGFAVSTSVRQGIAAASLTDLAGPFGVPAAAVDGTDVDAVVSATVDAVAAIRGGFGPRFLEMRCVRMGSHSTLTREERLAGDVERFIESDPLLIYERRLRDDGVLDDERWVRIQAEVNADIAEAETFVEAAAWPDPEAAVLDV
jgi:TPP-dependent pyruvate/acetoin dehydrogenase alpha subunit